MKEINYGLAINQAFDYLLEKHSEVFAIGQGLWSPWYVGNTMNSLEKKFGKSRVIDSPVSELACTGVAIGASLNGFKPIVIHPRMDFMLLAVDQIVNQAAKWRHMLGGAAGPAVTIRGIINRGGEQGAQHSQSLHAWFAHIPGLRVVMPATTKDARDLLIASTLCEDPVVYIDDRWLYEQEDILDDINDNMLEPLSSIGPKALIDGSDITLVGCGFSTKLCLDAAKILQQQHIFPEVIDLRVLNPLDTSLIEQSIIKTGNLIVVDEAWKTCGIAGEIIAKIYESVCLSNFKSNVKRITLPDCPAPTSRVLEDIYYTKASNIVTEVVKTLQREQLDPINMELKNEAIV